MVALAKANTTFKLKLKSKFLADPAVRFVRTVNKQWSISGRLMGAHTIFNPTLVVSFKGLYRHDYNGTDRNMFCSDLTIYSNLRIPQQPRQRP